MLYFFLLVYIVFFIKRRSGYQDYRKTINLYPFKEKLPNLKKINGNDLSLQMDFFMDVFGNILMFIPFPFALVWLLTSKISYPKIFLIVVLTSLSIEISQFIFNKGVPDMDDVILNSAGGCIGIALQKFTDRIKDSNL